MKINWLYIVIVLAIIFNITDLVTSYGKSVFEANPLVSGDLTLFLLKGGVLLVLIYMFFKLKSFKTGDKTRFVFASLLIVFTIALGLVSLSNSRVTEEDVEQMEVYVNQLRVIGDYEQLETIEEAKTQVMSLIGFYLLIYPLFISFISFLFYRNLNRRYKKDEKEESNSNK